MKKFAVIVAGGKGVRMGHETPKQFLEIAGKPIIVHTIEVFLKIQDTNILLTLPKAHFATWEKIKSTFLPTAKITTVEGGETRFHSVQNALNTITEQEGLVAIHDGVRPCVNSRVIDNSFTQATEFECAITSVNLKDSIREVNAEGNYSRNRDNFKLIQTPQTFNLSKLKKAYQQPYSPNFTDDASVFEANNNTIHLVEGDYNNIKITTQEDLIIATSIINRK